MDEGIEVVSVENGEVKSEVISNFFDDIVMAPPACRRDKQECESCSG